MLTIVPPVVIALLMVALSRYAGDGISDPDALWHIRAGDVLRQRWQFAGDDPLGTFTHGRWILNQWLGELLMSVTHSWGGLPAVAWLTTVGRIGVCLAVYAACVRRAGSLPAAVVTAATVVGVAGGLSPRPQLVAFVLLAVTVSGWLATATDLRPRWWLVGTAWLWACCHGTWVVGVMVGLATVGGLVLERRLDLRGAVKLALLPMLSVVVATLTPLGPALFSGFAAVRAVSPYIQEWQHPSPTSPSTLAVAALATSTLLLWWRQRELRSWSRLALWLLGVGWAALYARTVPVGAIILAPLAAEAVSHVLGRPAGASRWQNRVVGLGAALALAVGAAAAAAGPHGPVGVPERLSPALDALPVGSVVWNDDALGGWLIYSHPSLRQTADTRAELYGVAAARSYLMVIAARPGWEAQFDRLHPQAVLVGQGAPLVDGLERRGGWHEVGRDGGFVLLEAVSPP